MADRTYRVTFEVTVQGGHPRKWVQDAIDANLEDQEMSENWSIVEIENKALPLVERVTEA